ncbi:MAG: PKD domain-containing protein [Phycisphaerales bacterium]
MTDSIAIRPTHVMMAATLALSSTAVAQLRIASWNVTNYNTDTSRDPAFRTSFYGVIPAGLQLAGRSMAPDVIVGQEFISQTGVTNFRNLLNNAPGSPGDWVAGPFVNGADTDSAFFYRSSRVTYLRTVVTAVGSSDTNNQPRNTYRYDFHPIGYPAAASTIGVYSVHLKAQGGTNDAGRRLIECQRIRDNAEGVNTNGATSALPAGYNFIVAGDLNITSSSAAEYQELVGSQAVNTGRVFDPIATPGTWNNAGSFRMVATQEQTGNMDDRFDQMLFSTGLLNGSGLEYIGNSAVPYRTPITPAFGTAPIDNTRWNDPNHSYRSWGNDGTTFNAGIAVLQTTNNGVAVNRENGMVGATIAQALIDSADGNGHLPIFADFRVPPRVQSVASINFGQVTIGTTAQQTLTISNGTATDLQRWTSAGIGVLGYTLSMPSGFTTPGPGAPPAPPASPPYWPPNPAGSFYNYAGNAGNVHTITMNTATLGIKSGVITINAPAASEGTAVQVMVTGEVVAAPNQPPMASAGLDQNLNDCDGDGSTIAALNGSASTDPDGTIVNYRWSEGAATLADGATASANVALAPGLHTILLTVTDNQGAMANDTLLVDVNARPTANAGPDQVVTDVDSSGAENVTLSGVASADSDGTITGFAWTEGTPIASGASPTVALTTGTHTLTLTVTDNDGCTHADTVNVKINQRPTAHAGADQTLTDSDNGGTELVTLDGTLSADSDGTIAAASWSILGSPIASGLTPTVNLSVGTHIVVLTVTDSDGATGVDSVLITIDAGEPGCAVDFNNDGFVEPGDLDEFITAYFSTDELENARCDFNNDGFVEPGDLDEFITAFFEGC